MKWLMNSFLPSEGQVVFIYTRSYVSGKVWVWLENTFWLVFMKVVGLASYTQVFALCSFFKKC